MNEEIQMILDLAKESMAGSIEHLEKELTKIRAGKANPSMLDTVKVEAYGSLSPLNQVANVNTLDARTLSVQPWDKSMLEGIERAIINGNLGLNPQNNGEMIIINIPTLTEERRRDLTKNAKAAGEHAKVGIRNARKAANDEAKKMEKDGDISEDMQANAEGDVQALTDSYITKVDALVTAKEKDVMTV